jgi:hypothetical protein
VAAEGEQPGLVALNKSLESAVMPAPDERDKALIGLKPKQGRSACKRGKSRGVLKCGSFQRVPARGTP